MLKLQEKLFFRSIVRMVLLLLWFGGSVGYYIYLQCQLIQNDIMIWGASDVFFMQLRACYFFFVCMALIAFDYFRETADAGLLEVVKVGRRCFVNDCVQFFVLLQFVLLSGILMLIFQIFYFRSRDVLTPQILEYLGKICGLYIGLNGIVAILLGWFLARRMNKIMGYVGLLLFCILVSPNMVVNFNYLFINGIRVTKFLKQFYIMPEIIIEDGMMFGNYITLIPVHITHFCRVLFWVFLFMTVIVSCYSSRKRVITVIALICMMVGSYCVMLQPASYYSGNDSYDQEDAVRYAYVYYVSQGHEQKEKEAGYMFYDYDIDIALEQQMKVRAVLKPSQKDLNVYDMTLYHLYNINNISDQNGKELAYEREGDYLTIYNDSGSLEEIVVTYSGGCSNFYSNKEELYLPACIPYYPVPGFCRVYDVENQSYLDNRLRTEAVFDITFTSASKIYSDLPEIGENHFVGESSGALFVSGFFKEQKLKNGAVCIYSYLDSSADPSLEKNKAIYPSVLQYMVSSGMWDSLDNKKCIFTPGSIGGDFTYITEDTLVASAYSWEALEAECHRNKLLDWYSGQEKEDAKLSKEELIDNYVYRYQLYKRELSEKVTYSNMKQQYMEDFADYLPEKCTDEMFDQFFIENIGEQELEELKGK